MENQKEVTQAQKEVTQAQVDEWKRLYGEVHEIEVAEEKTKFDPYLLEKESLGDSVLKAYLKKPDQKTVSFAMSKAPAILEMGKVVLKNCWLGGDERILSEGNYFDSAAIVAVELVEMHRARLKKT